MIKRSYIQEKYTKYFILVVLLSIGFFQISLADEIEKSDFTSSDNSVNDSLRDEWMGVNSEAGSAVTTTELQNAIHHKLENIPVKGYHLLTTQDLEEITAIWQSPNGVSSSVSINVKIKPSIALEITPENINFGKLSPGETSGLHSLTLKNKGGSDFYITAEIIDTSENLFKDGFLLDSAAWDEYTASLASLESNITNTSLAVPDDYAGIGLKKGELVFWAQT